MTSRNSLAAFFVLAVCSLCASAGCTMNKTAAATHMEGLNLISDGLARMDGFAPMFGMITRLIKELKALDASQLS